MLVLSRKLGEKVYVGDDIEITVIDIDRGKIRLGVEAPKDVLILRGELRQEATPPQTASQLKRQRTRAEVLAAQASVYGCCNRHVDNQSCDCLATAVRPRCETCNDRGYTQHPQNGRKEMIRCPHGCPVKCNVCRNPNCDNPDGQH